jgi:hypothetical protein
MQGCDAASRSLGLLLPEHNVATALPYLFGAQSLEGGMAPLPDTRQSLGIRRLTDDNIKRGEKRLPAEDVHDFACQMYVKRNALDLLRQAPGRLPVDLTTVPAAATIRPPSAGLPCCERPLRSI